MALRREIAVRDSSRGGQALPSRGGWTVWPSSIAGRARTALQQTGRPTRVEWLLRAVNRLPGPKISAATFVGELARDVRQGGGFFRRTAPGEYTLAGERRGRGSR